MTRRYPPSRTRDRPGAPTRPGLASESVRESPFTSASPRSTGDALRRGRLPRRLLGESALRSSIFSTIGSKSLRREQTTRFFMKGSVRDRTLHGGASGLQTHVEIESDEPIDRIQELVRMAEQTCFTLGAWTQAVPTATTVTLNGSPLAVESRGEAEA